MDFDLIENKTIADKILSAKNNYDIFGIDASFMNMPNKSDQLIELKKLYKNLSLKVHPDRNKAPNATEAFQRLNNAYTTLKKSLEMPVPIVIVSFATNNEFNFFMRPFSEDRNHKCAATTKTGYLCRNIVQFNTDGSPSNYCRMHQDFNPSKVVNEEKHKAKVGCRARCKNGDVCKNSAQENSLYCGKHQNYNPDVKPPDNTKDKPKTKCAAKTKADKDCKNMAQKDSKYCARHQYH
jgi:hypothetical protein